MKQEDYKEFREKIRLMERKLGLLNKGTGCCAISLSQCHALVEIGHAPKINLRNLAQCLDLDISTMSRCIDSLVKKHLVSRTTSLEDRRCVHLELTEEGFTLFESIENNMNDRFDQIFHRIPDEQRMVVLQGLDTILLALQEDNTRKGN
ncbi:MarR family winged helix-turn-helix transcriptional regulator [Anaerosporobacter faecicola]|uniref:MarR family winged helix-turn-helix transcriptional regulator n=1 Tax=Anaerosporobacter faecicola TaxID=2718714 RepID=UPI00143AD5FA|nr:MarR family transcriptional regulator [Anaerosporobacter faecicola]